MADAAGVSAILSADNTEFGANADLMVDLTAYADFSLFGAVQLRSRFCLSTMQPLFLAHSQGSGRVPPSTLEAENQPALAMLVVTVLTWCCRFWCLSRRQLFGLDWQHSHGLGDAGELARVAKSVCPKNPGGVTL